MARHHGSVHSQETRIRDEAFIDGVCHAIDMLVAIGEAEAARRLEAVLFKPAGDREVEVRQ